MKLLTEVETLYNTYNRRESRRSWIYGIEVASILRRTRRQVAVRVHSMKFDKKLVVKLIDNAFVAVTSQQCKNYCEHVEKIEDTVWKAEDDIEHDRVFIC